jgi:hypothetical protein
MKYPALAFLFCLGMMSNVANADPIERRKVVFCDKTNVILETVKKDFDEEPIWYAKDLPTPTQYMITASKQNDTWTLIQFDDTQACVLGVGTGSKILQKLGIPTSF